MRLYKNHFRRLLKLIFIASISFILLNCASHSPAPITQGSQSTPLLQQAQAALSNQQFLRAANLFVQLANTKTAPLKNQHLISAAHAYISAGDLGKANNLINARLQHTALVSPSNKLALSSLLLDQGKTNQALRILMDVNQSRLSTDQRISLHTLSSSAFSQAGNLIESVHERIALDRLLTEPYKKLDNQRKLIGTLGLFSQQALDFLRPTADSSMAGWIDLSAIIKQQTVFDASSTPIGIWKEQHPTHTANNGFLTRYSQQALEEFNAPNKVAVFLPSQGSFAQAADSIRKGISVSSLSMQNQWPINIHYYDTSSAPIETLYNQAINDGVDFIIGPLEKANVARIAALPALPIPVITLNKSSAPQKENYYEFSLSPEEDVTQVLSLAWLKGYEKALILAPQSAYGTRLANHFSNIWEQLGGQVLAAQAYPLKQADYSPSIKRVLQLDESQNRFKLLRQRLNLNMKFEERRRQDADFIFLIASPREGRLIKPQLRFHRALKLPVFSTSKIYTGSLNKVSDRDLDGTFFCDMPWLIEPKSDVNTDFDTALELSPSTRGLYSRLMALGYDAHQVIPHLKRLKSNDFARFKGKTGILSVEQNGLISRQLNCGQFKRGEIKSLGLAPHLERTFDMPMAQPSANEKVTPL